MLYNLHIYDHEDNTPIKVAIEKLPKIEEDINKNATD